MTLREIRPNCGSLQDEPLHAMEARFHRPGDSVWFNINVVAFQPSRLAVSTAAADLELVFRPVDRDSLAAHSSLILASDLRFFSAAVQRWVVLE